LGVGSVRIREAIHRHVTRNEALSSAARINQESYKGRTVITTIEISDVDDERSVGCSWYSGGIVDIVCNINGSTFRAIGWPLNVAASEVPNHTQGGCDSGMGMYLQGQNESESDGANELDNEHVEGRVLLQGSKRASGLVEKDSQSEVVSE